MGELTRFRVVRNPSEDCGDSPRMLVPAPDRESPFLLDLLGAAGPDADRGDGYSDRLAAVAAAARAGGGFDPAGDATFLVAQLIAELTEWLRCHSTASPDELVEWLIALLARHDFDKVPAKQVFSTLVSTGDWRTLLGLLEVLRPEVRRHPHPRQAV